ncbi:MAG: class I SAM-dependent methyltransferase [Acidobacteria bacterium]|nr:class I SAM-dependent methyltransferase [Acidobacteriota bacterium]
MGVHMSFKPGKLQADAGDPSHGAQPAIQIHLDNPKLQAYLQRYPFAQGPDPEMNQLGRSAIAKGVKFRPTAPNTKTCLLKHEQTLLAAAEQSRAESLLDQIAIPDNEKRMYFDDFEWETNFVPRETKSVLVIGCGNGIELIFLRAVLPNARIMAIDYHDARLPKLGSTVGMQFLQGDICEHLASFDRSYDLIFSNHTLEHLYDPDEMLAIFARLLLPGGCLLSTLPMAGKAGTPFLPKVHRFAAQHDGNNEPRIHPLDLVYFDSGHPWKTNPDDLSSTVKRAGFKDVKIFQRENHISRPARLSPSQYHLKRRALVSMNRACIGPTQNTHHDLPPRNPRVAD